MTDNAREKALPVVMIAVGLIFIFGIYTLGIVWPSGWVWHEGGQSNYLQMILGVYATLGVFLILGARNPRESRSLIWFTVWSSVVHGAIMGVQAMAGEHDQGHLLGDVPALFIVAVALAVLAPRSGAPASSARA